MMGSWQDWIVALVVVLCIARVGMSIWNMFLTSKKDGNNPCAHCPQPCDLKRQYDQKVQNCCHEDKKSKKSCCE